MKRPAFTVAVAIVIPAAAAASNWTEVPGATGFVDMASVRQEGFPIARSGIIQPGDKATYTVARVRVVDKHLQPNGTVEVVFDCKGKMAAMQQIIRSETAQSRYHSFDLTQNFGRVGPSFKSIVPDSVFDGPRRWSAERLGDGRYTNECRLNLRSKTIHSGG